MLTFRSAFALLCQIITYNRHLKKHVWDDVNKNNVCPLATRSGLGTITNLINYSVTKYLNLTLIAVVNNLTPPVTVVFAVLLLKEKIALFQIIMLVITVAMIMVYAVFPYKEPPMTPCDLTTDPTCCTVEPTNPTCCAL